LLRREFNNQFPLVIKFSKRIQLSAFSQTKLSISTYYKSKITILPTKIAEYLAKLIHTNICIILYLKNNLTRPIVINDPTPHTGTLICGNDIPPLRRVYIRPKFDIRQMLRERNLDGFFAPNFKLGRTRWPLWNRIQLRHQLPENLLPLLTTLGFNCNLVFIINLFCLTLRQLEATDAKCRPVTRVDHQDVFRD